MPETVKCLYFDDDIDAKEQPFKDLIDNLQLPLDKHVLAVTTVAHLDEAEKHLTKGGYALLFLDIRIQRCKGGGIDGIAWQRTGLALIKRIREGLYESTTAGEGTGRKIPIIVITAVADANAQEQIRQVGEKHDSCFTLLEKPVNEDNVRKAAVTFIDFKKNEE